MKKQFNFIKLLKLLGIYKILSNKTHQSSKVLGDLKIGF